MPSIMDIVINTMPVSETHNHTLYMAIAGFVIAQLTSIRWPMVVLGLDHNSYPRFIPILRNDLVLAEQKITAGKTKLTKAQLGVLKRMYAAHLNGLENLPLFYVAIVGALVAGLPAKEANALGAVYLVSRVAYNISYAMISTQLFSPIRTIIYWFGMLVCFSLLWRSGDFLNKPDIPMRVPM